MCQHLKRRSTNRKLKQLKEVILDLFCIIQIVARQHIW